MWVKKEFCKKPTNQYDNGILVYCKRKVRCRAEQTNSLVHTKRMRKYHRAFLSEIHKKELIQGVTEGLAGNHQNAVQVQGRSDRIREHAAQPYIYM